MSKRRPATVPPPPAQRSGAAVARALASVLLLAALLAGLPVLLGWATPQVWETGREDLAHLLDRPDGGGAFMLLLLAVGWVAWAHFACSVIVEAAAQLHGRAAHRRHLLGPNQRLAAVLVGSVLVLLPTSSALATPATATSVSVSLHHQPATAHDEGSGGQQTAAAQEKDKAAHSTRTYTVREARPAETLGSIAEEQLGSFDAWHEIADLNEGRVMTDGQVFDARFLQPGWKLLLPEAAREAASEDDDSGMRPAAAAEPERADRSYTVQPGDNLSRIAEDVYGDAGRYPQIVRANPGKLSDPDLIYPGQKLTLPHAGDAKTPSPTRPDHSPAETSNDKPKEAGGQEQKGGSGNPEREGDRGGADGREDNKREDRPGDQATLTPSKQPPQESTPGAAKEAGPVADSVVTAPRVLGAGALLAAGMCGALGVKRILQQRRRRPGETIAVEEPTVTEQRMTAAAEPGSVERLDAALRALGHNHAAARAPLPPLRAARVTARSVQILLDDASESLAAELMAPFVPLTEGWWEAAVGADVPAEGLEQVPAPYPGLVAIGSGAEGEHVLLNLPHAQVLLLDGPPERVREVARAVALDAATCAWSDHSEILTVGLGQELPALLPKGRVRAVPHLAAAARDLGEILLEAHQQAADDDADALLPWLLVCAAEAEPDQAWALADALAAARSAPVALVLPAEAVAAVFPQAERLDAAQDEAQPCALAGQSLRLGRVTDDEYDDLVAGLRIADRPAQPARAEWQHVPAAVPQQSEAAASLAPVAVSGQHAPEPAVAVQVQANSTSTAARDSDAGEASPFPALLAAVKDPGRVPATAQTHGEEEAGAGAEQPLHQGRQSGQAAQEPVGPGSDTDSGPSLEEDADGPQINVLGPVEVSGVAASGHGYKIAALAALLYLRPGRSAMELCEAMDPNKPWSKATLQSRVSELRARLGTAPDGTAYLPRDRQRPYRFAPQVQCDWAHFQRLARRGLEAGPPAGLPDLAAALALVRGRPLTGPSGADLPWATPLIQEMLSRIIDVAHTIATWHRTGPRPDLDAARQALTTALAVDDTADVLYQDWIRVEAAAGNRAGVYQAVEQINAVCRRLDVEMLPETEAVIEDVLSSPARTA
ncbi:LysM peptidoglycan-binding domain-containing protein [Streptomyces smyrnaeus]|uniref:LysM peptidoglycan-binding domain-containing protein n=1 Tax=Streptomyces smyrnaeus TaxID=1387713 RepID=A0ABS3Y6E4_9ACTN|nr:LysM peptidoglycan-binding domain-containing protein [Streptomyces smyrnaeus]MBO8203170.1 LysM peptidoglycan-binding domain-containing protein [Streptomyces smyrnaeus]